MDILFTNIDWAGVVIGAIAAFALGAFWYSPKLFAKKWIEGNRIDTTTKSPYAGLDMAVQFLAMLLLAWVISIAITNVSVVFAALISITVSLFIKANGMYAKKGFAAIAIEVTYIIASAAIMILAQLAF